MPALNRVQLIGYLGKDPESKYTPTGRRVTDFPIAVTNRWKSRDGETKESTEWVNIEAWERLGETCRQYLQKGSLVYIEGRLKTNRYEDQGEIKYFTKVVAYLVQFLSDSRDDESLFEETHLAGEEDGELTGTS
ncbi:MAG TPA: single-stranded DNA-binding protein [Candidatus Saccharimonadales bacterium]|nr:single-stranded DNA-binding protein [Candidatus Saccharimonadales bacterium]